MGEVMEVGSGVKNLKVGDRVVVRLRLDEVAQGYRMFTNKQDDCVKVVLKP